jgi:hypothetical protein
MTKYLLEDYRPPRQAREMTKEKRLSKPGTEWNNRNPPMDGAASITWRIV